MITMQKAKRPSHVTIHSTPSPYRLGEKEVSPPKKKTQGQNRLPFFTGSTTHSVAQNSTNCKEKYYKTGHIAEKRDMPRFYVGVGTDRGRVPFNEALPKSPWFPLCAVTGRVREPMYWYRVRSVTGKAALRQIMLLKYETFLV